MKVRTAAIALTGAFVCASPCFANDGCEGDHTPDVARLSVVVTGVRSSDGEVAVTVYPDDKRRFLAKGGKLARIRAKAAPTVRVCFWLPPDKYEVAIYHDANGDHDFNRTLMGLPAEGFGFSNDPETKVGLPPISAARFALPADGRTITIPTHYLK